MLCVSLKYNYCQRMCHLNKDRCRVMYGHSWNSKVLLAMLVCNRVTRQILILQPMYFFGNAIFS